MKELIQIQKELKAPKNQRNKFGNYNYRSCEDILEAVKPLCVKYDCLLLLTDEVVSIPANEKYSIKDKSGAIIGHDESTVRTYVKATASLTNTEGQTVSVSANAREPFSKKGMDEPQVTGATSSYARKYALNGLFCIDDNKDADNTNDKKSVPKEQPKLKKLPENKFNDAVKFIKNGGTIKDMKKKYIIDEETEVELIRQSEL